MNTKTRTWSLAAPAVASVGALVIASSLVFLPVASAVVYPTPTPVMATPTPIAPTPTPASMTVQVATHSTSLGVVLTGPDGHTLYTLSSDPNDGSGCTGGCLTFWPPLLVGAGGTVIGPAGVTRTFGTFTRTDDAATQVTVDHRPLYYFANDTAAGQTHGEGIKAFGGVWHVAGAFNSYLASLPSVELPGISTVPKNGDVNPYGVAVVPRTAGRLVKGDVLVSNFNNKKNLQGTGTTIVELAPNGARRVFASISPTAVAGRCPGGVGLTTALVALRSGWVIVGSLPTKDGMAATAKAGCLIVLNSNGRVVETFHGGPINGPWDMTALDGGSVARLFVTNVLNGTVKAKGKVVHGGTIVRLVLKTTGVTMPKLTSERVIASGFGERSDPAALVIGPTGLALDARGVLFVADTLTSRIAAVEGATTRGSSAGTGRTVSHGSGLNMPLGLALAPGGDILTVNGGDGNIVETTPGGTQVSIRTLDGTGGGGGLLFGLALRPGGTAVYFVDDGTNSLGTLH